MLFETSGLFKANRRGHFDLPTSVANQIKGRRARGQLERHSVAET